MARLSAGTPRVVQQRARPQSDARKYDRGRDQPWRAWYHLQRWQKLRLRILFRDAECFRSRSDLVPLGAWPKFKENALFRDQPWLWPVCQRTGVLLIGGRDAPHSAVVDHIKPHRGDPDLFWDEGNLQAVSKGYHDRVKQSLEQRGGLDLPLPKPRV